MYKCYNILYLKIITCTLICIQDTVNLYRQNNTLLDFLTQYRYLLMQKYRQEYPTREYHTTEYHTTEYHTTEYYTMEPLFVYCRVTSHLLLFDNVQMFGVHFCEVRIVLCWVARLHTLIPAQVLVVGKMLRWCLK